MSTDDWNKATWSKSSRSAMSNCVELSRIDDTIGVRDSKNRTGAVLEFTLEEWRAFAYGMSDGEFEYLSAD